MVQEDFQSQVPTAGWRNLLFWLEQHGMRIDQSSLLVEPRLTPDAGYGLFALVSCSPSTSLFTVPASCLVNIKTLLPHYPSAKSVLSATQLISLHLFLHRPVDGLVSSDPLYGPYLSILPREFEYHPLTLLVRRTMQVLREDNIALLDDLPPSVASALHECLTRFRIDWDVVRRYLQDHPDLSLGRPVQFEPDLNLTMDFLCAWLNVNTRCIYHRLSSSRTDPDNITLCPILDFANHTTSQIHMMPRRTDVEPWNLQRYKIVEDFTLLSPVDVAVEANRELYLTYGAHTNRRLFVEYGFTNALTANPRAQDTSLWEVDVQDVVESLFLKRGTVGAWMKEILTEEGYWGDWTLHYAPEPAHPSWRLVVTLRLYHIVPLSAKHIPLTPDGVLRPWRDTLLGMQDLVSEENEYNWRHTLLSKICLPVVDRATAQIQIMRTRTPQRTHNDTLSWMHNTIMMLWEEERRVGSAVAESIQAGKQF